MTPSPRLMVRAPLIALVFSLCAPLLAAQPQTVLFPDLQGEPLRAAVVAAYRPASVLGEAQAKDRLYDTVSDTTVGGVRGVIGVYTGFFVALDCQPSCDPSQDVYNQPNENTQGLNLEHTWPQSLLSGQPQWDLHHLFPTKVNVNGARGNLPFAEIPDHQTTRWYRDDDQQTAAPPEDERDEWSELRTNVAFEPREAHKGDVARALAYVWTMYRANVTASFWTQQEETLYAWHGLDPVDWWEYNRSEAVADFQSGKANPFVLDSTLFQRIYFPTPVGSQAAPAAAAAHLDAAPNPLRSTAAVTLTLPTTQPVRVEAFDVLGRRVALLHDGAAQAGAPLVVTLDATAWAPGLYVVRATGADFRLVRRVTRLR